MYKVPVIIGEDTAYVVFFEPSTVGVLVHCDVRAPWSKTLKSDLMTDWSNLLEMHRGYRMIARHYPEQGEKHIKFLKMFGFKFSHEHGDFDIYTIGGE